MLDREETEELREGVNVEALVAAVTEGARKAILAQLCKV
jgi:hypothetical protein